MGQRGPSEAFGIVGVVIGLVANSINAYAALSLLAEPDGAQIRPMGEAAMLFFGALIGLCGAVFAFQAVRQQGARLGGSRWTYPGSIVVPTGVFLDEVRDRTQTLGVPPLNQRKVATAISEGNRRSQSFPSLVVKWRQG